MRLCRGEMQAVSAGNGQMKRNTQNAKHRKQLPLKVGLEEKKSACHQRASKWETKKETNETKRNEKKNTGADGAAGEKSRHADFHFGFSWEAIAICYQKKKKRKKDWQATDPGSQAGRQPAGRNQDRQNPNRYRDTLDAGLACTGWQG
uniref:Uncharacterized protein n=1 Tax=Anopheles atroparvus TaxID=41427 RepID=A0AAG5DVP4_ANOAO